MPPGPCHPAHATLPMPPGPCHPAHAFDPAPSTQPIRPCRIDTAHSTPPHPHFPFPPPLATAHASLARSCMLEVTAAGQPGNTWACAEGLCQDPRTWPDADAGASAYDVCVPCLMERDARLCASWWVWMCESVGQGRAVPHGTRGVAVRKLLSVWICGSVGTGPCRAQGPFPLGLRLLSFLPSVGPEASRCVENWVANRNNRAPLQSYVTHVHRSLKPVLAPELGECIRKAMGKV
eukprot:359301-Chlamydomonas_euryale.AAC.2